MSIFSYECLNKQGETIKGVLNADSIETAAQRLKGMGLIITNLTGKKSSSASRFLTAGKKVALSSLSLLSRQLSAMIRAGIPVTRALATLSKQESNPALREVLVNISRNVEGGMNLTEAFSAYPNIFSDLYVSMIRAGELGGMLDEALLRLSEQLQKEKVLKDNIKSATFYPRIILAFAAVMMIGMLVLLVPVFKSFMPADMEIPAVTRIIFGLSDSIRSFWYIWLAAASAVTVGAAVFFKSPASKRIWEHSKFKLPIFGKLIHKSVIARFSRTLATLLDGGIPVIQALEGAGPTSGSILIAEAVSDVCSKIQQGKNIAGPLEEAGDLFPPMMTQMIAIGEETGALSSLLEKIAEFYEEEVETMSKGLMDLIQPLLFIVLGIMVGGMLIAMYLPMFNSVTQVGG